MLFVRPKVSIVMLTANLHAIAIRLLGVPKGGRATYRVFLAQQVIVSIETLSRYASKSQAAKLDKNLMTSIVFFAEISKKKTLTY